MENHPYKEAYRYVDNAKTLLGEKAKKNNGIYQDEKYVRMAGDTAWKGVLIAVTYWLKAKKIEFNKNNRPDVDWYIMEISKINMKLKENFRSAYNILHKSMGYDGEKRATIVSEGINLSLEVISSCEGDS